MSDLLTYVADTVEDAMEIIPQIEDGYIGFDFSDEQHRYSDVVITTSVLIMHDTHYECAIVNVWFITPELERTVFKRRPLTSLLKLCYRLQHELALGTILPVACEKDRHELLLHRTIIINEVGNRDPAFTERLRYEIEQLRAEWKLIDPIVRAAAARRMTQTEVDFLLDSPIHTMQ